MVARGCADLGVVDLETVARGCTELGVVDVDMVARGCTELNIVDLKTVTHRPGSESRIITCVFQAGRLLLNGSDFSAFQNNFFGYTTYGVNLLDLIGFLT